MQIKLRKFEESDIEKIENWYINLNEWMEWDAPWEWENYTFNKEKQILRRLEKSSHEPCFEFEIIYGTNHVGWLGAYYITDEYKWNGEEETDKIAIGIDIPEVKYRGLGIGKNAYELYLEYFKSLGYKKIYTQTWSGNLPMINLALRLGFKEINRYKDLRTVKNKKYDALTFEIEL